MNANFIVCCIIGMVVVQMSMAAAPDYCALASETGICNAYIERYYFNSATGACELFVFGGCQGNVNNFETIEACQAACIV